MRFYKGKRKRGQRVLGEGGRRRGTKANIAVPSKSTKEEKQNQCGLLDCLGCISFVYGLKVPALLKS